jgi:hypothetical protein
MQHPAAQLGSCARHHSWLTILLRFQMKGYGMDSNHWSHEIHRKVYKFVDKEPEIKIKMYITERDYECSWNGTASGNGPIATSCERRSRSEIFGSHNTRRTSRSADIFFSQGDFAPWTWSSPSCQRNMDPPFLNLKFSTKYRYLPSKLRLVTSKRSTILTATSVVFCPHRAKVHQWKANDMLWKLCVHLDTNRKNMCKIIFPTSN